MGVLKPPTGAGSMSPGVLSPPQARLSPVWPPAAAQQLTWHCSSRAGGITPAAPPLAPVPSGVCPSPPASLAGSSAAPSTTLWRKLAGLTRGRWRTNRRLS